jgi:hypothetical protein
MRVEAIKLLTLNDELRFLPFRRQMQRFSTFTALEWPVRSRGDLLTMCERHLGKSPPYGYDA